MVEEFKFSTSSLTKAWYKTW